MHVRQPPPLTLSCTSLFDQIFVSESDTRIYVNKARINPKATQPRAWKVITGDPFSELLSRLLHIELPVMAENELAPRFAPFFGMVSPMTIQFLCSS